MIVITYRGKWIGECKTREEAADFIEVDSKRTGRLQEGYVAELGAQNNGE